MQPPARWTSHRTSSRSSRSACVRCHARGNDKGGFSIETRESMLRGGDTGPAVVPGQSARQLPHRAGVRPRARHGDAAEGLAAHRAIRSRMLRAWIDQGAAWDPGVSFARAAPRNLARRGAGCCRDPAPRRLTRRSAARTGTSRRTRPQPRHAVDDRLLIRRAHARRASANCRRPPTCARSSPTGAPTSASAWSRGCSPTSAATPSTG